jgi:hypothetical protein
MLHFLVLHVGLLLLVEFVRRRRRNRRSRKASTVGASPAIIRGYGTVSRRKA